MTHTHRLWAAFFPTRFCSRCLGMPYMPSGRRPPFAERFQFLLCVLCSPQISAFDCGVASFGGFCRRNPVIEEGGEADIDVRNAEGFFSSALLLARFCWC